jgi:hypothetical protein
VVWHQLEPIVERFADLQDDLGFQSMNLDTQKHLGLVSRVLSIKVTSAPRRRDRMKEWS